MSNIFSKNISALSTKNPESAKRIENHIPDLMPELIRENNFYNIIYKGKKVHNPYNPLSEAKRVFLSANNSAAAIHLIYGLGLGYLFQTASLSSRGTVILYEPDLNILRTVFELVDFSEDILKKNIYFTDKFDDIREIFRNKANTENTPVMLSLPSQRDFNPEKFDELVKNIQEMTGVFTLELKYAKEKFYLSLKMLLENLPNIKNEIPLAKFKDAYKGKTALVVSAGPTLDRDIDIIKKNRDKVVIFAVGTALKTLDINGIKPDFLCIIETWDSSKQLEGKDFNGVYFITEPYSNPNLRKFNFKKVFLHISSNMPASRLLAEICGEDIEEYCSKGTVSYTALNCARLLGCSKIVLSGQDLAYIEGQCYSKDSSYKDLVCKYNEEKRKWEITAKNFEEFSLALSASDNPSEREKDAKRRLEQLNDSLYYVKGINGDMIPTESVYSAFIKPLSEFTEHFNDRVYINTSLKGAQIDGFENMPLQEALCDSAPVGNIELETEFTYDTAKILSNLEAKLKELQAAEKFIAEGKKLLRGLNNDLKRYKNAGTEVLKSLKKVSSNYISLSADFAGKSKMFDIISTAGEINLDYEIKKVGELNYWNIKKIYEKLAAYYDSAESGINEIEELINENLNTKS